MFVIVEAPVALDTDIPVPATFDVTPVFVIDEAPEAADTDIPVPAPRDVTPVFAIVAANPAPPSANDIPVPAVRTLSLVRVASVARVTYSASVGAPPPPPPAFNRPFHSPATLILANCMSTMRLRSSSFTSSTNTDSAAA